MISKGAILAVCFSLLCLAYLIILERRSWEIGNIIRSNNDHYLTMRSVKNSTLELECALKSGQQLTESNQESMGSSEEILLTGDCRIIEKALLDGEQIRVSKTL